MRSPNGRTGHWCPLYPIVYIDAIWLKIRDGGVVVSKACHVAVGVDVEGRKQILGLWLGTQEGRSSGPTC